MLRVSDIVYINLLIYDMFKMLFVMFYCQVGTVFVVIPYNNLPGPIVEGTGYEVGAVEGSTGDQMVPIGKKSGQ